MRALALADEVYLGTVARAEKLKPEELFDTEAVIQHLASQGVDAFTAPNHGALLAIIRENTARISDRPQVVVFFTNGSFGGIIGEYVRTLRPET
jgi:UDP-N-acetylmuramate: L-alanyl-gamma-D-glutamyl-meso-diaminopimelate ligase